MSLSTQAEFFWIIGAGVLALVYSAWTAQRVLASNPGNEKMQEIAAAIQAGAGAFLNRQYRTIAMVGALLLVVIAYFLGMKVALGFLLAQASSPSSIAPGRRSACWRAIPAMKKCRRLRRRFRQAQGLFSIANIARLRWSGRCCWW